MDSPVVANDLAGVRKSKKVFHVESCQLRAKNKRQEGGKAVEREEKQEAGCALARLSSINSRLRWLYVDVCTLRVVALSDPQQRSLMLNRGSVPIPS